MAFFFDTLPIHPQPRAMESLTSYLVRLAETNLIDTVAHLSTIVLESSKKMRNLADFPLVSWGDLELVSKCPLSKLLDMTFYHLGSNFGRPNHPRFLGRFLHESITDHLRFCPTCLSENPYYLLPWRFSCLVACPIHKCKLLDRCKYCQNNIPIFASPLKIATCQYCQSDLRMFSSPSITPEICEITERRFRDLEFLLFPQVCGEDPVVIQQSIGQQFLLLRQTKGLSRLQVGDAIALTESNIEAIELGKIREQGAPFQRYIKYADYLEVSFHDIFTMISSRKSEYYSNAISNDINPIIRVKGRAREEVLMDLIRETYRQMAHTKQVCTPQTISETLGISLASLRNYPEVRAFLSKVSMQSKIDRAQQREKRESNLLQKMDSIIQDIKDRDGNITQTKISQSMGLSIKTLHGFPRIKKRLLEIAAESDRLKKQRAKDREEHFISLLLQAKGEMESYNQVITQKTISEYLGVSLHTLKYYPRVREILDQFLLPENRNRLLHRNKSDSELLEMVKMLIDKAKDDEEYVTAKRVVGFTGVSWNRLNSNLQIRELLDPFIGQSSNRAGRNRIREDEIMVSVKQAIEQLKLEGQKITYQVLYKRSGITQSIAMYYPRVMELIQQSIGPGSQYYLEQKQLYEDELLKKVLQAIQQLTDNGETVTLQAISDQVAMSMEGLKQYVYIREILEQVVGQGKLGIQERKIQREEELYTKVVDAIKYLESQGITVTQNQVGRIVGMSRSGLRCYPKIRIILERIAGNRRTSRNDRAETN